MSETIPDPVENEPTEPAEVDTVQLDNDKTETDPADPEKGTTDPAVKARREAKNLRDRLRETENERDSLSQKLTAGNEAVEQARTLVGTVQTRRAQELAESLGLIDGADLWREGATVADVCDPDTGGIDPARVAATIKMVTEKSRHLLGHGAPFHVGPYGANMDRATLIRNGIEPPIDAPAADWDAYRLARARLSRAGASSAREQDTAISLGDILRAGLHQ